jgi:hypothetical protein
VQVVYDNMEAMGWGFGLLDDGVVLRLGSAPRPGLQIVAGLEKNNHQMPSWCTGSLV